MATIAFELPATIEYVEMKVILATMEINHHNQTKTAKDLGISARTLYSKLKQWERSPGYIKKGTFQ